MTYSHLPFALIQNFELGEELANELALRFQRVTYNKGTLIFGQGDMVKKLYFLESGLLLIFLSELLTGNPNE